MNLPDLDLLKEAMPYLKKIWPTVGQWMTKEVWQLIRSKYKESQAGKKSKIALSDAERRYNEIIFSLLADNDEQIDLDELEEEIDKQLEGKLPSKKVRDLKKRVKAHKTHRLAFKKATRVAKKKTVKKPATKKATTTRKKSKKVSSPAKKGSSQKTENKAR